MAMGTSMWFRFTSTTVKRFTPFGTIEPASQTYALSLGDLDLDGDLDLVVANWGPRTQQVDSDGDGIRDRWVETAGSEMSRVYLNDGRAKFVTSYAFGVGNDRFRSVALGDVDRDGDVDIVAGSDCHTNKVFYNSTLPKQTK